MSNKEGGGLPLREAYAEPPYREHIGALSRSPKEHIGALVCEVCDGGFGISLPHCFSAKAEKLFVGRRRGVSNRPPEKRIIVFRVPAISHTRVDLLQQNSAPHHDKSSWWDPAEFYWQVSKYQSQGEAR